MKSPPVVIETCWFHRDLVVGTNYVTVGVRDVRMKLVETRYEVRRGSEPGTVELVKEDGEVRTVHGCQCCCQDSRYRRRATGCKHTCAVRMVNEWFKSVKGKNRVPMEEAQGRAARRPV